MANERVMVFIDGANLYTCMRDYLRLPYNVKVDAFGLGLAAGRELVRIYYYNSPAPPSTDQASSQRFWAALGWLNNVRPRQGRIVPKTVETECPKCHKKFSRCLAYHKIPVPVQDKGVCHRTAGITANVNVLSLYH